MPINDVVFDRGGAVYNVLSAGTNIVAGAADISAALEVLVNRTIPAAGGTVWFPPGTYAVGRTLTFPAKVDLVFASGAGLTVAAGATLTIKGPITGPLRQVFFGTGAVIIAKGERHAAWFGLTEAEFGGTAAINAQAIQRAIDSIPAGQGGKVSLHRGEFPCSPNVITLKGRRNVTVEGEASAWAYQASEGATKLVFSRGAGETIGIDIHPMGPETTGNVIRNLFINGSNAIDYGIRVSGANSVEDTTCEYCAKAGISLVGGVQTNLTRVSCAYNTADSGYGLDVAPGAWTFNVSRSNFRQNKVGVRIQGAYNSAFRDCVVESNTNEGLVIHKPFGGQLSQLSFDNVWVENNQEGRSGYQMVIDSGVNPARPNEHDPPLKLTFRQCTFQAMGSSSRNIQVVSASWVDFVNCAMTGGDTARAVVLESTANYVYFHDCEPQWPAAGAFYGNRGGVVNKGTDAGDPGGYRTNMWWQGSGVQVGRVEEFESATHAGATIAARRGAFEGSVANGAVASLFRGDSSTNGNFMAVFHMVVTEPKGSGKVQTHYYRRVHSESGSTPTLVFADITGPVTPAGQKAAALTFTQSFSSPTWTVQVRNGSGVTLGYYGWFEMLSIV